eukprot:jgi/Tetstr1/462528/TSEL_007517.t1
MDDAEYQDNLQQQEEELDALTAIYGDDCQVWIPERRCEIWLPSREASPCIVLRAKLPSGYPSQEVPQVELEARHLDEDLRRWMMQRVGEEMQPGGIVLFAVAEWIKDQEVLFQSQDPRQHVETERHTHEAADELEAATLEAELQGVSISGPDIVTGPPFMEKKSTFQGHVATVHSAAEVEQVMETLLRNNKVRNATHNIMAYRIHCPDRGTLLQDHDEDGENAAGGRLLNLLQIVDARDVIVIVSRWYGGVKLGPSRFTIINNVARELLVAEGYVPGAKDASEGTKSGKGASGKRR